MKANKRAVVLALGVVVVLAAALWAVLTFTEPGKEEGVRVTYTLIGREDEELERAVVTNAQDCYTVYRAGGEYTWQVQGNEALPQQKSRYYEFARFCTSLTASYRIETDEYEKYGLDRPVATAEITYTDGETVTVTVGDRLRDESYRYYMLSGDDAVYAGNSNQFDFFMGSSILLVDTLLAPHVEGKFVNDAGDKADAVTVYQNGETYRFEVLDSTVVDGYGNSYLHRQAQPAGSWGQLIAPEVYAQYFGRVMELGAYEAVAVVEGEAALAAYGFDAPDTELVIHYEGTDTAVAFVKDPDGPDYLAHKRGTDVVWRVVARIVTWTDIDRDTLISRYFLAPAEAETNTLAVTVYGETAEFVRESSGGVFAGGTVSTDSLDPDCWDDFYKLCCSVNSGTAAQEAAASGEVVASLVFTGGYGTRTLELRRADTRTLGVWVDGVYTGYVVRETFAERLQSGLDNLAAGQPVDWNW